MKKLTKEQEYIDNLENRVNHLYDEMRRNVEYSGKGKCGEIDLMGRLCSGGWDIYEVKTTDMRKKRKHAREQLYRVARYSPYLVHDMYMYFARDDNIIFVGTYNR